MKPCEVIESNIFWSFFHPTLTLHTTILHKQEHICRRHRHIHFTTRMYCIHCICLHITTCHCVPLHDMAQIICTWAHIRKIPFCHCMTYHDKVAYQCLWHLHHYIHLIHTCMTVWSCRLLRHNNRMFNVPQHLNRYIHWELGRVSFAKDRHALTMRWLDGLHQQWTMSVFQACRCPVQKRTVGARWMVLVLLQTVAAFFFFCKSDTRCHSLLKHDTGFLRNKQKSNTIKPSLPKRNSFSFNICSRKWSS